ncbi:MAG: transporter substrate-binding domain-containing protein, partial [Kiritimatiellia bacterium]|nr:transporter substrate-binding domain-containing protein [Kiritimatiellia bacterium]
MRRTAPCLWLLVLSALAPAPMWASTTSPPPVEVIRVVGDDNYPPYFFRANDGTLRGIVPDQWALWENKTGIQVNLVATNWGDALRLMQDQDADVLEAAFQTPERDRLYDFTPAYAQIPVPVFSHRSLGGIADVSSLRGFTIGVKEGDAVIETLAAHGIDSIQEYPNYEAIVQAAKNQDLRVFSIDEPSAVYYLYKFGIEDQFRNSFVLYTGALHRAVHKGSAELLALVQEGFDHISPAEYRAIDEKWMGTPVAWRVVVRRFAWLLLTGIVAVLLLGGGNLILGRQVQRRTAELNRRLADLRASQDDLQNSRQYFATVFNTIHDALFILDAQTFEVLDINQRMVEMFGYTSRQ